MSGYGHQLDQPVRKLEHCQSLLNDAYMAIQDLEVPYLKILLDRALDSAAFHALIAEEKYREKS